MFEAMFFSSNNEINIINSYFTSNGGFLGTGQQKFRNLLIF